MATLTDILILLAVLAAYGIVGRMDYDDAVRHEEFMRARHLEQGASCAPATTPERADTAAAASHDPLAQAEIARDCPTSRL